MKKLRFSEKELKHLFRAWLAISLAFALTFARDFPGFGILATFGLSCFTVGLSFVVHELAHKFVAQKYGCWAEFRAFDLGLILAVVMAFFGGFIFAAPGAVMISGPIDEKENGKIAAVGPAVNLSLALLFTGLIYLVGFFGWFGSAGSVFGAESASGAFGAGSASGTWLLLFLALGRSINSWLAFFNLLPFGIMDGLKVQRWNPKVWLGLMVLAAILVFA